MAEAFLPRRSRSALGMGLVAALVALVLASGALAQPATAPAPASASEAGAAAPKAVPTAADPALEARMLAITGELRCLVCQNQTIADSHADLAVDLRQEVRELIRRGRSDDQIRRYMTDRYGDFVLYKPPFKASTAVLWLGPGLLLAVALVALIVTIARRRQLADDRFEPDPDWGEDDAIEPAAIVLPKTTARTGTPA